jgi:cell division septation protein DedD
MSVHPIRPVRACVLAAVAAALLVPSGAVAKPKGHGKAVGKTDNDPAVCEREAQGPQSPGLEKNGKTPPGQAKKTEDAKPCSKDAAPAPAAAEQPAPSSVPGSAPSQSPQVVVLPPCTSKRYFRITLGKRKNVKRARVLLNGRPIPITRGKRKVTALIDLRRRVKGTYVVRTVVVSKRLRIRTGTRRYRVCGG